MLDPDAFARFLIHCKPDLQRIARHTRGETSIDEVQSEAWLMVADLAAKGRALDLSDPAHQKLLLSRLYQHLVRYTELNVRYAVRLDHSPSGEEGELHPLAHVLAASEEYDPAVAMLEDEQRAQVEGREPAAHESLAGAYLHLLRAFDNSMRRVAEHLLISLSYSYRRCAHARVLAVYQQALPAPSRDAAFVPGAWRRFRLMREPVQMALDFGEDAPLFGVF